MIKHKTLDYYTTVTGMSKRTKYTLDWGDGKYPIDAWQFWMINHMFMMMDRDRGMAQAREDVTNPSRYVRVDDE